MINTALNLSINALIKGNLSKNLIPVNSLTAVKNVTPVKNLTTVSKN